MSNLHVDQQEMIINENLARFFFVLGDPTRLRILHELGESEKNVSELSERLGLTVSAISHQLKILRDKDLVRSRRDGKFIYYRMSDDHVRDIIRISRAHLCEDHALEN